MHHALRELLIVGYCDIPVPISLTMTSSLVGPPGATKLCKIRADITVLLSCEYSLVYNEGRVSKLVANSITGI